MQEQKSCIKKRITRGMVTGQNHTLQKCRDFWSSVKNSDNFSTKPHVWKQWLRTANSFNNKCNGRSYAQVVAQNLVSKTFGQNNQMTIPNHSRTIVFDSTTSTNQETTYCQGQRSKVYPHKPSNSQRGCTSVDNIPKNLVQSTQSIILTKNKFAPLQNLSDNDISATFAYQQLQQPDLAGSNPHHKLKKLTFKTQNPTYHKVKNQSRDHSHLYDAKGTAVSSCCHDTTDITTQNIHTAEHTHHDSPEDNTSILEDIHIDNRIPQLIWDNRYRCSHYLQCTAQMDTHFGFIPITPLQEYHGPPIHWQTIPDMLKAHKIITESRLPNFMKCRIPVQTHLKPQV